MVYDMKFCETKELFISAVMEAILWPYLTIKVNPTISPVLIYIIYIYLFMFWAIAIAEMHLDYVKNNDTAYQMYNNLEGNVLSDVSQRCKSNKIREPYFFKRILINLQELSIVS